MPAHRQPGHRSAPLRRTTRQLLSPRARRRAGLCSAHQLPLPEDSGPARRLRSLSAPRPPLNVRPPASRRSRRPLQGSAADCRVGRPSVSGDSMPEEPARQAGDGVCDATLVSRYCFSWMWSSPPRRADPRKDEEQAARDHPDTDFGNGAEEKCKGKAAPIEMDELRASGGSGLPSRAVLLVWKRRTSRGFASLCRSRRVSGLRSPFVLLV